MAAITTHVKTYQCTNEGTHIDYNFLAKLVILCRNTSNIM